jgi:hypothetical protein
LWRRMHSEAIRFNRSQRRSRNVFHQNELRPTDFNSTQQRSDSASGAGGRWFKSTRPDHSFQSLPRVFVYSTVDDFVDGGILKIQYMKRVMGRGFDPKISCGGPLPSRGLPHVKYESGIGSLLIQRQVIHNHNDSNDIQLFTNL